MNSNQELNEYLETEYVETADGIEYDFGISRRNFVKVLGAGFLITLSSGTALAQRWRRTRRATANYLFANSHRQGWENNSFDRQN